jgi:asparagine synthase (glutamine-hydrolysing)
LAVTLLVGPVKGEVVSGIAGIIRFDGAPIDAGQIAKITSAMANRGPDGIHHWIAGSVALGHCMLRTTPESREEIQPLANEDESLILVMDGRLDNREELKQALRGKGIQVRSQTDTELVLGAYQLWGEDSPRHLLGDFAFAVWDVRRQELFCARDHFGVKPFHYFTGEKFLAFASDEEAFFQLRDVPREPNEDRIAYMLVPEINGYDSDASWLKDIVKLSPGKTLSVRCAGQKVTRIYWQLEPQEESRFASDLECEEAFRSVFSEAVRRRIRTIGNPTLMLSGGIDSASIAGAARAILRQMPNKDLQTFSVVSDEVAACTETRNIQSIIRDYEQHAHLIAVPSFEGSITVDDVKEAAWTNAHPVANSILLPAMMHLAASRAGHRVMLDGIDGDLVTDTPLRYPSSLLRSRAWREAWAECRQASVNNTYLRHEPPLRILSKSAWDAFAPSSIKCLKRAISSVVRVRSAPSLINPDFAKKICLAERLKGWQAGDQSGSPLSDQDQHIRALLPVNVPRGMEGYDRVASRYGIEARHPWSDKTLIEFYVRLPLRYKARAGWTKYLVRKAAAPWLDKNVRWHTGKDHLGRVLVRSLLDQSSVEVISTLGRAREVIAGGGIGEYLDTKGLSALLKQHNVEGNFGALYDTMTLALCLGRIRRP